jgi:uncharacterized protein YdeI (YjbR/CyaY-like superfamily)
MSAARGSDATTPRFFRDASAFRRWLETNHDRRTELWVGFRKRETGLPSITWSEAVDQALCFGWIDSVRKRVDEGSYTNRFTPRKPASNWSAVNTKRFRELQGNGLVRPAGLRAFEQRSEAKTGIYSYENRHRAAFDRTQTARFKANRAAWAWFSSQPPWYRTSATWWVVSAKREETRDRRLTTLIDDSAAGRPVKPLARPAP